MGFQKACLNSGQGTSVSSTPTRLKQEGLHQISSTYGESLALPNDGAKKIAIVAGAKQSSFLATILIKGCDEETSSTLREMLVANHQQYSLGTSQYPPQTTSGALEMLQQFKGTKTPGSKKPAPNKTAPQARTTPTDTKDKESTAFINKGEELSSSQLLMVVAAEQGEDFGSYDDQSSGTTIDTWTYWWEIHNAKFNTMIKSDSTGANPNTSSTATTSTYSSYEEEGTSTVTDGIPDLVVPQSATDNDSCSTATNVSLPQAGQPTWNGHNPTTVGPTNQSSQPSPAWAAPSSNLIPRIICTASFLTPPDLDATSIFNLKHPQTNVKPTNARPASMDVHSQNRSKSSINLISNGQMVKNIWPSTNNKSMTIHCNSGSAKTNQVADLPGFGVVWLYKDGIANVLFLLALVTDQF
eukprot:jgi/Psemu1/25865/gm1.25865_g